MARKKRTYHHGDLRRVLLDASIELIARRGVDELSLREVARHAGVSPAAPYHHFASKAELLGAIAIDGFGRLATAMRSARDREDAGAPIQKLRAIGEAYVRFAIEYPAHFHLMFHSTLAPVDSSADGPAAQSFAILLEAIAEVMALPEIEGRASRPGLVVLAWSLVHGAAALLLDGPLTHGLPELGIEAGAVPALVTSTFEALLSARPLPVRSTPRAGSGK
jgi:AcrR family transcriptional regulator